VFGAFREEGRSTRSPLSERTVACSSPSRSQASAHVARRRAMRGRSASRKTNRAAPGGRAAGSVIVRSAPAKAGGQSAPWQGRTGSREPARPRNARKRVKGDSHGVPRGTLRTAAQTTWLSRVGRPQGHDRPTRTGRRSGAGKGQRARTKVRARASVSRLQTPVSKPPARSRGASQSEELAKGGQPERVARLARGAAPSEEGR
jgi:hypothetical protein